MLMLMLGGLRFPAGRVLLHANLVTGVAPVARLHRFTQLPQGMFGIFQRFRVSRYLVEGLVDGHAHPHEFLGQYRLEMIFALMRHAEAKRTRLSRHCSHILVRKRVQDTLCSR